MSEVPTHKSAAEAVASDTGKIGQEYYDQSTYFVEAAHLQDFDSAFQKYRVRKVLELYTPAPTDKVLDLGCGWGTITFALAKRVRSIVGLDFSARAVELCKERFDREGVANATFVVGDATDSGMEAESFDVVVAADLFEHLYPEDSEAVAVEAYRLLKPGGRFAVWTPCRRHFLEVLKNNDVLLKRDISHVDYKSMDRMREIMTKAGFGIERAYFAESHLPVLSALERAFQAFVPLLRRRVAVLGQKPPRLS